jgi:predicted transcriptional regulator
MKNTTEKLELKHLAPYQEHKVKLMYNGVKCNIAYLSTKRIAFIEITGIGEVIKMKWDYASGKVLPILRPLSDLTTNAFVFKKDLEHIKLHNEVITMRYYMVEYLFQNHFDVFGLIEKGLAIDINTI